MITAIALDDEPLALSVLERFCLQTDFIQLQKTFTKPSEALSHLKKFPVDLLFLDVQMPTQTGIDFYKAIPQPSKVIFTTAYTQYAVEGFNLSAVDYLLKPFTYERFLQAANKAQNQLRVSLPQEDTSQSLLLRVDYGLTKVQFADILYVQGLDDYLKIYLHEQKTIVVRLTMKALMEKLPSHAFIRVHRSYIVPLQRITAVKNKTIFINQQAIAIGASYEEEFFSRFVV